MTVYGVDAVEEAAAHGRLVVGPRDRLTPLARDRAVELDLVIIEGDAASVAPAATVASASAGPRGGAVARIDLRGPGALPSPPVPALFRRGAPYPGLRGRTGVVASSAPATGRVARVTVVGAGNVGTHAAMRLAETDLVDEIVLVDVVEGLARGVALDLTHAAGLLGFATRLRGESSIEAAGESAYTIITAGRPRQPGMSRADLTATNAEIVGALARAVGATSPHGILVVVTNPLDEMTQLAWKASGLPSTAVIGMAGLLDSARFQALAGLATGTRPDAVAALALGSHGDEMVIPLSQARVGDVDAATRLGPGVAAVVDRTRDSGAEVVGLLGKGSAFITPGLAAARMVEYMIRDDHRVVSATVRAEGQYGVRDVFVGLPVRLGRGGVAEIVEVPLTSAERAAVVDAAEQIRARAAVVTGPTGG
jgi:malate dehydrogenase